MGQLPRAMANKRPFKTVVESPYRKKCREFMMRINLSSDSKLRKTISVIKKMKNINDKYSFNNRKDDFNYNASMHTIMKIINSYKSRINFVNNVSILCPVEGLEVRWLLL